MRKNPSISPFEEISEADYPGIFKDFDADGIPNVDDPNPLTGGDTDTVEEVSLSKEMSLLIEVRNEYQSALHAVMDKLRAIDPAAEVKGRVKSPYSTINKLRRKRLKADILTAGRAGERYTQGLTDMAGCMIVLPDQDALDAVVTRISAGDAGDVFEHENLYKNPVGGYRAHHFIVIHQGLPVEVQVKTERMTQITEASHTPYKRGVLNAEYMGTLTDLAWKADKGDPDAQKRFAAETESGPLQQKLTLRANPSKDVAQLQEAFRASVQKLALVVAAGKFPDAHQDEGLGLFRAHGELIGVDFDAVYSAALEQAEQRPEIADHHTEDQKDSALESKFEIGRTDLELKTREPIDMTTGQRAKANDAALAILQKEDRAITATDIETLRRYTGNGGLKDKAFANEAIEGKKRGSLNEHYTSYPVIQMIWDKMGGMGVRHGNILEPGSGIGNFAGFLPDRQAMRMLMVEQSVVSSRIAGLLYPNQVVLNEKFQNADLDPYSITGVIGNVPFGDLRIATRNDPFREINPQIHDYFILKSLDALKPGGWLAVITSIGTADKKDRRARQAMTARAGLVGAYRLPSTAFKANADTLVTTDLLIFQKYHDPSDHQKYATNNQLFANSERAVATGTFGSKNETYEAYYNAYFAEKPDQVLGEHIQGHNAQWPTRMGVRGAINAQTIEGMLGDGLEFALALPEQTGFYDVPDSGVRLDTPREYHPGNIVYHEGGFYEKKRVFFEKLSIGGADKAGDGLRGRIRSACEMLDLYDDFVTALARETEQKEPLRGDFKRKLQTHIDTYGVPDEDADIRRLFKYDNRLYKLTTFVKRDPVNEELVYADIIDADSMFSDNYTPELADSGDLTEVAVFGNAIGETLTEDFYLSAWKGGTGTKRELNEALDEHTDFFYNPENERYEFRYEYLAGDVRAKLEMAENYGLQKNVEALKAVLPGWIDVFKIQADPRHIFTYLPHEVLQEFITEKFNYRKAEIGLVKDKAEIGNRFYMRLRKRGRYLKSGNETQADENLGWGTIPFTKILNNYIQDTSFPFVAFNEDGQPVNITKKSLKEKAKTDEYYNDMLARSNQKQGDHNEKMLQRVPQVFNNWLRTQAPSQIREKVEHAYNRTFNSNVNPTFDGSTLRFRGMSDTFFGDSDFRVYKHNRAVAEKMIWNGRGANCHDVGAGKTMASIITSQVLLQQGAARKPMFVVPGKVQEKWVEEYSQLFPDAKILNMKMKADNKHKELTMAQLYNWDAIFIADHSFKQLALSPDEQARRFADRVDYFDRMIDNFDENIEAEEGMKKSAKNRIVKNLEKQKEEFETKLANVSEAKRLETDIYFDELGVDCLFFDEAHFYKNAISSPKAQKLGIAANKTSQRAEDVLQKTRWLYDQVGYRNVFVLTATPVVNSPIEVWHMLNLCAPDLLEKYEIHNLDNFINLYVRTEEKLVKKTTGKYQQELVVGGYVNLPEMRKIIDEVMDIKSYDQLIGFYKDHPDYYTDENGQTKPLKPKFKRPDANLQQQIVEPSALHKLLFDDIVLRANEVMECLKTFGCETRDNFLVITGDGSKIATDLRVYDNDFDGIDQKYLKLGQLVDNVTDGYQHRENPAPRFVSEDIYGDYFNRRGRNRTRSNPAQTFRNQIIFCDWISLEGGGAGSFHELIKEQLVEAGIPAAEIAIINGSTIGTQSDGSNYSVGSGDDKEELKKDVQDDFNQGKYRIIIGNKSIAEGMNLQVWTTDLHHMDVPYTPSEIQQRNGRGLRQGNQWPKVNIHFYLMQDSFDQYRLELVNKKQSWIDELFFGEGRTSQTQNEAESLNYEQMVAATNSDPRVKEFFNAKAKSAELKGKIKTLDEETQRLRESLARSQEDIENKRSKLNSTIEREKALMDSSLPDDAGAVLDQNRLHVEWTKWNNFGDIRNIEIDISSEHRKLFSDRVKVELDVPLTNENGRVLFHLIPFDKQGQRQFYNKIKWSSIKKMAPNELEDAFGWSTEQTTNNGLSLSGNKGNFIATESDFYEHYGIDIEAEREGGEVSYEEIKRKHDMLKMKRWVPIVESKLAELFLILERAWVRSAEHRTDRLREALAQAEQTLRELEGNLSQTQQELSDARRTREQAAETQSRLTDVVNEIVAVEYEERSELYEELNRLAPKFGVRRTINVRDIDADVLYEGETGDEGVRENPGAPPNPDLPDPLKTLFKDPLVYAGKVNELEISQDNGYMERLQAEADDLAMIFNADGDTIFIFPTHRMKMRNGQHEDTAAEEMYETFHHFPADDYDFELFPPDNGTELLNAGHANRIIYVSDKVIQAGDRKGKGHTYYHNFDAQKRPVYKYGDVTIIGNLNIDGRGILN